MPNNYLAYFSALVKHETDLWNLVEAHLAEAGGTTLGRLKALHVIEGTPNCRIQDIADGLGITVGAASRLTDRLEADGFVSRAPNPGDRRGSIIHLVAAGEKAIAHTEPLAQRALERALGTVDPATLVAATETLTRFNAIARGKAL